MIASEYLSANVISLALGFSGDFLNSAIVLSPPQIIRVSARFENKSFIF